MLQERDWTERFAQREETERYLRRVVEKFDLHQHIRLGAQVVAARWSEEALFWTVEIEGGETVIARFLLTAIGLLSAPAPPRHPGVEDFEGVSFHTYNHPSEKIDYRDKRVPVIGTGATGVRFISAVADQVESLTVF